MEDMLTLKYGVAGICVLLTIMILVKVSEFVLSVREKRDALTEKSVHQLTKALQQATIAVEMLDHRMKTLEASISEFPKLKNDLRRFYSAIKEIAGERWPEIRDEIMKDGFNA